MAISKKELMKSAMIEEEKAQKQQMRQNYEADVHNTKVTNSAAVFQNTKITTCSKVLQKNGQAVALAFNHGAPKPVDIKSKSLQEVTALSQDQYKVRENLHAGMLKKPLEPYHPNAFRSRLPQPTVVMPYKNSSQIVIGDRSSYYKRQFVSTNQNTFVNPKQHDTVNPGIISEKTRRNKHLQNL